MKILLFYRLKIHFVSVICSDRVPPTPFNISKYLFILTTMGQLNNNINDLKLNNCAINFNV